MSDCEVLFTITMYRDGRIAVAASHLPDRTGVAGALRVIANSIEAGATLLHEQLDE